MTTPAASCPHPTHVEYREALIWLRQVVSGASQDLFEISQRYADEDAGFLDVDAIDAQLREIELARNLLDNATAEVDWHLTNERSTCRINS